MVYVLVLHLLTSAGFRVIEMKLENDFHRVLIELGKFCIVETNTFTILYTKIHVKYEPKKYVTVQPAYVLNYAWRGAAIPDHHRHGAIK